MNEEQDSLILRLNLPPEDDNIAQDYEYIVTDANRIEEFITFYQNENLSDYQKHLLITIEAV